MLVKVTCGMNQNENSKNRKTVPHLLQSFILTGLLIFIFVGIGRTQPPPPNAVSIVTTVDGIDDVGRYTSLVLNSNGFPVISYKNDTNDDLMLATCHNEYCTVQTTTLVDSDGNNGINSLIVLNSSGFPVIRYRAIPGGILPDLMLASCNNPTCTNPTITTVDDLAGLGSSLVLNDTGIPIISCWDFDYEDLRLAICNIPTCPNPTVTEVDVDLVEGSGSTSLALNSSGFAVIRRWVKPQGWGLCCARTIVLANWESSPAITRLKSIKTNVPRTVTPGLWLSVYLDVQEIDSGGSDRVGKIGGAFAKFW